MKKQKLPKIIMIAVFSLVTALVWAFSDILRSLTKPQEISVPENVLTPLDPTLNQDALTKIQGATFFEAGQVNEATLLPSPEPESTPAPGEELLIEFPEEDLLLQEELPETPSL